MPTWTQYRFSTSLWALVVVCHGVQTPAAPAGDITSGAPRPRPGANINYRIWLASAFESPNQDDAAAVYTAAAAAFESKQHLTALDRASGGPWRGLPAVTEWIDRSAPVFDRVRRGAKMERAGLGLRVGRDVPGGAPWRDALLHAVVPGLGMFDPVCKGMLARGWRAWDSGDEHLLIDNACVTLAVAHQLEREPPLVTRMTALAIAARTYRSLIRALNLSADAAALANTLAERLERFDPPLRSMSDAMSFQKLSCWDVLQRAYLPAAPGTAPAVADSTAAVYRTLAKQVSGSPPPWESVRASMVDTGFEASLAEADAYFDRLLVRCDGPAGAAANRASEIESIGESLSNLLVRVFVRDMTSPLRAHTQALTMQRGLRLLLRIREHRTRRNRFPESLDELVRATDSAIWRIDPCTGRDFVYARTRDGFVLYSLGSDQKDDAGRPYLPGTEAGDIVIWPPR